MTFDLKAYPVLYVDDEKENLVATKYALEDRFEIVTANTGAQALELLAARDFAVLVCDQRMAGMTGVDVCEKARAIKPDVIRMIVTAYADIDAARAAINRGQVSRYISKPWTHEELGATIEAAIEAHHLAKVVHEMEMKLLAQERAAAMSAVAFFILHDVKNQIQTTTMNLEYIATMAKRVADPATSTKLVSAAEDGTTAMNHCRDLVQQFMITRTTDSVGSRSADPAHVFALVSGLARKLFNDVANFEVVCEGLSPIAIDATELVRVIFNLLQNAVAAIEPGQPQRNHVSVRAGREGSHCVIRVRDTGRGILPEHLPRIFDMNFTTKPPGQAGGLGLAIARHILTAREGEISVESEVGKGTTFTVRVPLA